MFYSKKSNPLAYIDTSCYRYVRGNVCRGVISLSSYTAGLMSVPCTHLEDDGLSFGVGDFGEDDFHDFEELLS